jgi:hypothetical protein
VAKYIIINMWSEWMSEYYMYIRSASGNINGNHIAIAQTRVGAFARERNKDV